jgi:hypothetical protein
VTFNRDHYNGLGAEDIEQEFSLVRH